MNVVVPLLPKTIDDLDDPSPIVRMRAEGVVRRRFNDAVSKKYDGEVIDVTFDELFLPEPFSDSEPHTSQLRSTYSRD